MAAYLGGGTGSGNTHVAKVNSGGKKSGSMQPAGGKATLASKSAGKPVTKATPAAKTKATKTGTKATSVSGSGDASRRSGAKGQAGNAKQAGKTTPSK